MINLSISDLTHIALDLTTSSSNQLRYQRLLALVKQLSGCDACALLEFKRDHFKPLATDGLAKDVIGRRFYIEQHPRLEAIARAGDVVRFPSDSQLPDPYEGLITDQPVELSVHSCIGLPLLIDNHLCGALTLDALDPHAFDQVNIEDLNNISRLASASLHNALLLDKLALLPINNEQSSAVNVAGSQEMIGQSTAMKHLKEKIEVVADSGVNVLITGETGVGKELVALAIHQQSNRADKPLVYLNCAALPESIAESELFGHLKGAFTGAISDRHGKFAMADHSSIFLDEIGELPLGIQAKLLRVLQHGEVQTLGADHCIKVDTRIIAATNKNLREEVAKGNFRADLYHRLSVFPIHVPALRERAEDISLLSGFFIEKCREKLKFRQLIITPSALQKLTHHTWPGNVRELEHCIYRSAILAKSQGANKHVVIDANKLHLEEELLCDTKTAMPIDTSFADSDSISLMAATEQFQRRFIKSALDKHLDNWSQTAKALGLDNGNLHRKAKKLGLKP